MAVLPGEDLHVDDLADLAVGHLEAGVANLTGLLTEDGAQQALLGGELGLALRRDLADEHVAGLDLGAHPDDPSLVEVLPDVLGEVGDVARSEGHTSELKSLMRISYAVLCLQNNNT